VPTFRSPSRFNSSRGLWKVKAPQIYDSSSAFDQKARGGSAARGTEASIGGARPTSPPNCGQRSFCRRSPTCHASVASRSARNVRMLNFLQFRTRFLHAPANAQLDRPSPRWAAHTRNGIPIDRTTLLCSAMMVLNTRDKRRGCRHAFRPPIQGVKLGDHRLVRRVVKAVGHVVSFNLRGISITLLSWGRDLEPSILRMGPA
jgi:hypothetical protein